MVTDKLIPWEDLQSGSPSYGNIGGDLADTQGAEAWDVLEPILAYLELSGAPAL